MTDSLPPEDVAATVRNVLHIAVEAAIANWAEGHWEDFDDNTRVREILDNFSGFLDAWLEAVADDDDPALAHTLVDESRQL